VEKLTRTCFVLLVACCFVVGAAAPASADDDETTDTASKKKRRTATQGTSDESTEEPAETQPGMPIDRIGDVLTQPLPGPEGPSWLDERGEPPHVPPGRGRYKPDKALDVLYLSDGNILRGHLVKEDFPEHYAICVAGNSVVLVAEDTVILRTKEKPLNANRSHRRQVGLSFAPSFGGGFCVSTENKCTGGTENPIDFGGVPAGMRYQVALTVGVSSAVEIYGGAYFRTAQIVGTGEKLTVVDPVIGFRHFNPGLDVVKFARMLEFQFGVKPEFALRFAALTGIQVDPIRNIGFFLVMGPELEFIPKFVLGFAVTGGVQGRLF